LKAFTVEKIGLKTILGLSLIVLSFVIYAIFGATQKVYLIPIGVISFGIGFHLSLSKIKSLQSIKKVLTFIVIAVLGIGIFSTAGWDQYMLNSTYATMLAKMQTTSTVFLLNLFSIHATQDGTDIIFPHDSKIPQINILPACGGLHFFVIFLAAFALMLIDLGRKASKKKLAIIFVIGATSIFFANLMRLALLSYIAYAFGYDALETNHLYAGFLIFLSLIGVLWWLSLRWILKKPQTRINHQDLV